MILALVAPRRGNPYGYYVFLRWVACPGFLWIAWKAYSRGFGLLIVIAAGVLAVLFNPLIRVRLDRDKWEILNVAMMLRTTLISGCVSKLTSGDFSKISTL